MVGRWVSTLTTASVHLRPWPSKSISEISFVLNVCLLHSFGVDHDIPWLPCKGPKRARQTRIEVDIETGLVEIEALSLIFHHIANYWIAHLSGDCNV